MRKLVAIAWKDIQVRFSSPMEWLFFLILPLVFTVVLAAATGGGDSRVRLVVADQAQSASSTRLLGILRASRGIRVDMLDLGRAEAELQSRRTTALLAIPADFDPAAADQGKAVLDLRLLPSSTDGLAAQRVVQAAADRFAEGAGGQAPDTELVRGTSGSTAEDVEYNPAANSSAGQLITWVFIPLLAISALLAFERQKGTLRRQLVSPTPRSLILLGTIAGQVAAAIVQMLLLVVFGVVVMKLPWGREPGALAVMLLSTALAGAALGTFLGSLVRSEAQANGLSIMIGMVMALLGGCWYPLDLFPRTVQTAVKVLPTTWAMQGLLDVVARGQGIAAVTLPALVLLGFAVVFFAVGSWRFRAA